MNTKLIRATLFLGFVLSPGLDLKPALAQPKSSGATVKGQKSRGAADAKDENIKQDRQANDPNANTEAPPDKGGPKTRQSYCRVFVDNRTPWYIDIYMDGRYRGQVGPWGDVYDWVGCGDTNLYAKARFNGAPDIVWGPTVYPVAGTFKWSLTR